MSACFGQVIHFFVWFFSRRFTYRSLGSTSNAHERSCQHRNYVKILRFLSLICERSRREETFSLRSNVMLGNTMHSLVHSVGSNVDQQLPMDALNCVRLALECWPRIENIVLRLKQSYEPGMNVSTPSLQVFSLLNVCLTIFLNCYRTYLWETCTSFPLGYLWPAILCVRFQLYFRSSLTWTQLILIVWCCNFFQPKLNEEMKMLVGHLVQCLYQFQTVIADLEHRKLYHTSRYSGIK